MPAEPNSVDPKTADSESAGIRSATADGDVAMLSFEKALDELEKIVGRLERGDVPLEESIAIYERGEALKKRCGQLLAEAEARVERITLDADRKPVGTAPLDPD